jgi:hypothetical protein
VTGRAFTEHEKLKNDDGKFVEILNEDKRQVGRTINTGE